MNPKRNYNGASGKAQAMKSPSREAASSKLQSQKVRRTKAFRAKARIPHQKLQKTTCYIAQIVHPSPHSALQKPPATLFWDFAGRREEAWKRLSDGSKGRISSASLGLQGFAFRALGLYDCPAQGAAGSGFGSCFFFQAIRRSA